MNFFGGNAGQNFASGGGGGGTGYAGDNTTDKKRRAAGHREARTKEAHQVKERHQILLNKVKNPSLPPTDELLTILRQTLRNFGVVDNCRAVPHESKMLPLTLQIMKDISSHHPQKLGNLHGNDDSLIMALQDSTKTAQLKVDHPKGVDSMELQLAQEILDLFPVARSASLKCDESPEILVTDPKENYRHALRPFAFAFCDGLSHHHFITTKSDGGRAWFPSNQSNKMTGAQHKRLFQELSSYQTNLPIEFGSSILVRAVEDQMNHLRVLIFGPEDTPYANGCFLFDLLLHDYPHRPPKCQFLTTGGGKYRLNPNLYSCGKVCLSLLGTWSGPSWQSNESTLLQVLVSIQSLILGEPEPYFNEPGREIRRTEPMQREHSAKYNRTIREYTCAAAILPFLTDATASGHSSEGWQKKQSLPLHHPYPEFKEAIDLHFRLKRGVLIQQLEEWRKDRFNVPIPNVVQSGIIERCLEKLLPSVTLSTSEWLLGEVAVVDPKSLAEGEMTAASNRNDQTRIRRQKET